MKAWREQPVAGVGAGGYHRTYFAQRSTPENVRQPHSVELQVLAELGVAGALLFLAALLAVAAGGWRTIRARGRDPLLLAAVGVVLTWFVHASVDWMHLLPGLTAIALLGVAVLLGPSTKGADEAAEPAGRELGLGAARSWSRFLPAILIGMTIAIAAASLSRQSLSDFYLHRAQDALATDPARALVEANRALRIDREAIAAYYAKAAALARFGEGAAARSVLLDAARRAPRDFVTWVLLGDLSSRQGELRVARAEYRRALRLNPLEPGLAQLAADPRN